MVTISLRQRRALLWTVLAGGFLLVNFHRTATAVLAETLAATFGATGAELGSLHASFSYIYAALQLPAGLVVDRYGPRRVGVVGLAAMTAGVVWFGASGSLAEAFLARAAIGLGVLLFLILGANFTVLGLWGVPYVVDIYDVSVATASTYVLLGNVGFVVGPPAFGALSDRLARRTGLMVGAAVLFTLSYAALVLVPPLPVVGAALFLALFANGGVALAFTVGKERHESDVAGTVTGVINSLGYFGAAVLPTVLGAVLDAYWTGEVINGARVYTVTGYRVAFGIATIAGVLATGATVWLHRRHSRRAPGSEAATTGD